MVPDFFKRHKAKVQILWGLFYQFFPTLLSLFILSRLDGIDSRIYLIYLVSVGFVNLFVDYSFFSISPFLIVGYGINKCNLLVVRSILLIRILTCIILLVFINIYVYFNSFGFYEILILDVGLIMSALWPLSSAFIFNKLSRYYITSVVSRLVQLLFIILVGVFLKLDKTSILFSFIIYYTAFIGFNCRLLKKILFFSNINLSEDYLRIKEIIIKGWIFFKGNLITSSYTIFLPMLLPFLLKGAELTNFLISEKAIRPFCYLQIPLQQKTYSDISVYIKGDNAISKRRLSKYILLYFLCFLPVPIFFFFFGQTFLEIVFKSQFNQTVLRNAHLISLIVPIIAVSNVLGLQILPLLGKIKLVNLGLVLTGAFSLILYSILTTKFYSFGAAIALLFSELFITCFLLCVFSYLKIKK